MRLPLIANGAGVTVIADRLEGGLEVGGFNVRLQATEIFGGLTGTGTLNVQTHTTISGNHTFTGTMNLTSRVVLEGAQIPAAVSGEGTLEGHGRVAFLAVRYVVLTGVIRTDSATIRQANVVLPAGKLVTAGPIVVTGERFMRVLFTESYRPIVGETTTIFESTGAGAVQGTFEQAAEGGYVSASPAFYRISYQGGSGNDVTLTVAQAESRWTGASSSLWSDPGNWVQGVVPFSGGTVSTVGPSDDPPQVHRQYMTNDIAGLALSSIALENIYSLGGHGVTLTGDLFAPATAVDMPITVSSPHPRSLTAAEFKQSVDTGSGVVQLNVNQILGNLRGSGYVGYIGRTLIGTHEFAGVLEMLQDGSLQNISMPNAEVIARGLDA